MAYKFNPLIGIGLDDAGSSISALNVLGTVANEAALPGSATTGDVYQAEDTGVFYVWDGSAWDNLGTLAGPQGETGPAGVAGADGADGADGVGVVAGGTTGQVLAKASNDDYDTEWVDQTGGGGTPGGSDTQVQYNDGGSFAGDSGLLYDATSGALTVGGKTVTTDAPVINLSQTWNNAATTFTGLKLNVTNTASAAGSNLLDLQVGGTSKFMVDKNGQATFYTAIFSGGGVEKATNFFFGTTNDLRLYRDAANTLAQRNSTNAQTFRLYNTYTDASNYERTSITRDSSGLVIDAQKAGTGADPTNLLDVKLGGTSRFKVEANNTRVLADGYYIDTTVGYYLADGVNGLLNASGFKGISTSSFSWVNSANANSGTIDLALARDSAGVVKITDGSTGTGYIKQVPVAVSALPAAATVGAGTRGFVNDANATTFASVVAGGGANVVPVYSDGTDWRIG